MTATHKADAATFTMPSDHEIIMTRIVNAPRRLVFATRQAIALADLLVTAT